MDSSKWYSNRQQIRKSLICPEVVACFFDIFVSPSHYSLWCSSQLLSLLMSHIPIFTFIWLETYDALMRLVLKDGSLERWNPKHFHSSKFIIVPHQSLHLAYLQTKSRNKLIYLELGLNVGQKGYDRIIST